MSSILYNVEIAPDAEVLKGVPYQSSLLDAVGQFLLRPVTVLFPENHNFLLARGNQPFMLQAQQISIAKKVAVLFVAVLLLPLTLLGFALGSLLLSFSKTHRLNTCVEQLRCRLDRYKSDMIKAFETTLCDQQNRPGTLKGVQIKRFLRDLIKANIAERSRAIQEIFNKWLAETEPLIDIYGPCKGVISSRGWRQARTYSSCEATALTKELLRKVGRYRNKVYVKHFVQRSKSSRGRNCPA